MTGRLRKFFWTAAILAATISVYIGALNAVAAYFCNWLAVPALMVMMGAAAYGSTRALARVH